MTQAQGGAAGQATAAAPAGAPSRAAPPSPADAPSRADAPAQADAPARVEGPSRAHTRQRIQSVALELFAEQGYDKTSLREIAERLGVTKAALYYHFKSKEDIVNSLVEDFYAEIDELIAWGAALPRTPPARAEVLSRYYGIVSAGTGVFRMLQHNQASVNSLAHTKKRESLYRERMHALAALLTEPGAPVASQLRATMALASVSFGCMFYADQVHDAQELRTMVLGLAYELAGAQPAKN
jgi:AcrR family transcriptional regulator